jgi:hypothetical protein
MANKNNEKEMATELSGRPWSWLVVCVVVLVSDLVIQKIVKSGAQQMRTHKVSS